MATGPADEYTRRLSERRRTLADRRRADARLSAARLATFGLAALVCGLGWTGTISYWCLVVPAAMFVVLVRVHERVVRDRDTAASAIVFYERGLARIEDRWHGTGETGDRFKDDRHLYANDLDLFGTGSLFQLLSLARTGAGEEALANWLKHPAPVEEILARQDAVRELTPALDLREALSVAGANVRAGVDTDSLIAWAERDRWLGPLWVPQVALLTTAGFIAAIVYSAITNVPAPAATAFIVQLLMAGLLWPSTGKVLEAADELGHDLDVLREVLLRLEAEQFTTPRLAEVRRQLDTEGKPASAWIRRLQWLGEVNDWLKNMLFAIIGALLLLGPQIAWAIDAWRRKHGRDVRRWLLAIGELEAFASLSAYRYEHPDDPFPELDSSASTVALLEGAGIGHPLIPSARMVRNDVSFALPTRLFIISGSNMSGKSTMLRTVGVNTVLAQAGAPVRATRLRLSPLAIGATLRIQDSLLEGRSRFYAEITRIREVTDATRGNRPVLFLLDELFHGTNSHDRLTGAAGVLRALLARGAIGLVTTHDLALTAIAEQVGGEATNVHFDDSFEAGEIHFDYRMKPGPVTRSNAIALMQAVGLDVGTTRSGPS